MSKEDNGGSAFPTKGGMVFYVPSEHRDEIRCEVEKLQESTEGMSLRDYFAAKALFWVMNEYNTKHENEAFEFASAIARDCYRLADAMLEARKK